MITYELTSTIFASVILFTLVLFPVSGYVRAVAMGTLDFYGDLHHPIVFPCAPVVFTPIILFRSPSGILYLQAIKRTYWHEKPA
jgi:hypothetical protein